MEERRAIKPGKRCPWDEVRVITRPWLLTNELGSEWRRVDSLLFYNKGKVIYTHDHYNPLAATLLYIFTTGVANHQLFMFGRGNVCDQEGCYRRSSVTYKMKRVTLFPDDQVTKIESIDPYLFDKRPLIRKFCDAHSSRGTHCFHWSKGDDCDANYELIPETVVDDDIPDIDITSHRRHHRKTNK